MADIVQHLDNPAQWTVWVWLAWALMGASLMYAFLSDLSFWLRVMLAITSVTLVASITLALGAP